MIFDKIGFSHLRPTHRHVQCHPSGCVDKCRCQEVVPRGAHPFVDDPLCFPELTAVPGVGPSAQGDDDQGEEQREHRGDGVQAEQLEELLACKNKLFFFRKYIPKTIVLTAI